MSEYKMMIVDDNDGIRNSIKKFLSDKEIECESFETAEALLARLYPSVQVSRYAAVIPIQAFLLN